MIKQRFKIPLYFGTLIVVYADKLSEAADAVGCDFKTHGFAALSFKKMRGNGLREYCILTGPDTTLGGLVHECNHVVNFIFKDVDVILDVENDEPSCYLIQWIFNKAHTVWERAQKQPTT